MRPDAQRDPASGDPAGRLPLRPAGAVRRPVVAVLFHRRFLLLRANRAPSGGRRPFHLQWPAADQRLPSALARGARRRSCRDRRRDAVSGGDGPAGVRAGRRLLARPAGLAATDLAGLALQSSDAAVLAVFWRDDRAHRDGGGRRPVFPRLVLGAHGRPADRTPERVRGICQRTAGEPRNSQPRRRPDRHRALWFAQPRRRARAAACAAAQRLFLRARPVAGGRLCGLEQTVVRHVAADLGHGQESEKAHGRLRLFRWPGYSSRISSISS